MWPAIALVCSVLSVGLPMSTQSIPAPRLPATRISVDSTEVQPRILTRRLGQYVEHLSFDRQWSELDAKAPRSSLLQQSVSGAYCNWVRLVERGPGRAISERDQVSLRFRGVAIRAGGEQVLARVGSWQQVTLSLPQAGQGLQRALAGVEEGSVLHLLARPETSQPLDRSFATTDDDVQLLVELVVVSAQP